MDLPRESSSERDIVHIIVWRAHEHFYIDAFENHALYIIHTHWGRLEYIGIFNHMRLYTYVFWIIENFIHLSYLFNVNKQTARGGGAAS